MKRSDFSRLKLSKFNENIHSEHCMKCIVTCGVFFGFRSIDEHTYLCPNDIQTGYYESGHPFEGKRWVGIGGLVDKTQKLSVHRNYVRDTADLMKAPLSVDESCGMGALLRMKEKSVEGQKRLYCYLNEKTNKCQRGKVIGKNTIAAYHKAAAGILGVDQSSFVGGHAWRGVHISINANNNNLNLKDKMASSRHTSVSAFLGYIQPDEHAEAARMSRLLEATGNGSVLEGVCDGSSAMEVEEEEESRSSHPNMNVKPSTLSEKMQLEAEFEEADDEEECGSKSSLIHSLGSNPVVYLSDEMDGREWQKSEERRGFVDETRGRSSTYHGKKPVADEYSNLANNTQGEWLRLEEDVEAFDYGPYGGERRKRQSEELVGRARALVGERVRGLSPQQTARMSENQRTIYNLRMQLKEEKRMRDELYYELQQTKRLGMELARAVRDLERKFEDYHHG